MICINRQFLHLIGMTDADIAADIDETASAAAEGVPALLVVGSLFSFGGRGDPCKPAYAERLTHWTHEPLVLVGMGDRYDNGRRLAEAARPGETVRIPEFCTDGESVRMPTATELTSLVGALRELYPCPDHIVKALLSWERANVRLWALRYYDRPNQCMRTVWWRGVTLDEATAAASADATAGGLQLELEPETNGDGPISITLFHERAAELEDLQRRHRGGSPFSPAYRARQGEDRWGR